MQKCINLSLFSCDSKHIISKQQQQIMKDENIMKMQTTSASSLWISLVADFLFRVSAIIWTGGDLYIFTSRILSTNRRECSFQLRKSLGHYTISCCA